MMPAIQLERIQKSYGAHRGTRDVTFTVEKSEIFGFVGPNGAGKSTTLKILMGFIFADTGNASICGLDVARESKKIKRITSYVPSDVRLYPQMRVGELLKRNAGFYETIDASETNRLKKLFDIDEGKRFQELSTGNRKKVSIVCALMSNPEIIILDEPTSGLDPVMQSKLFEELVSRTGHGATVLLSSHNLAEVQAYCHRVAFIKEGSILAVIEPRNETTRKLITVTGGNAVVPDGFVPASGEENVRKFHTVLKSDAILQALGILAPQDFTVENESMEEYFWHLYGQEEVQ